MSVASPPRPLALRRDAPSPNKPNLPAPALPQAQPASPPATAPAAQVAPSALPLSPPRVSPRSDLAYSTGDAASYSLMVGLGETYFSAFALAIGTGQTFAGLLATLPQMAGALLQLASPWGVKKLGSPRRWIVMFDSLQPASFPLLPVASFFPGGLGGALAVSSCS